MAPASAWLWWGGGGTLYGRFNHGGLGAEEAGGEYKEGFRGSARLL